MYGTGNFYFFRYKLGIEAKLLPVLEPEPLLASNAII